MTMASQLTKLHSTDDVKRATNSAAQRPPVRHQRFDRTRGKAVATGRAVALCASAFEAATHAVDSHVELVASVVCTTVTAVFWAFVLPRLRAEKMQKSPRNRRVFRIFAA